MPLLRPANLQLVSSRLAHSFGPGSLLATTVQTYRGPRYLDKEERDSVRAARARFFGQHKRNISSLNDSEGDTTFSNSTTSHSSTMPPGKRFKFFGKSSSLPDDSTSGTPLIVAFYDTSIKARDPRGRTLEDLLEWTDFDLEMCHNYIQMLFPVPEGSAFNWEAPIIDRRVMDAFRESEELQGQLRKSFERMVDFYGFAIEKSREAESRPNNEGNQADQEQKVADAEPGAGETEVAEEAVKVEPEKCNEAVEAGDALQNGENGHPEELSKSDTKPSVESRTTSDSIQPPAIPTYNIIRGPKWSRNSRDWTKRFDHNHLRITRILRCLRVLGLQTEADAFFAALQDVFNDPKYRISERSMMYWHRAVSRPLYMAPDDDQIGWLMEWEVEQQEKLKEAKSGSDDAETEVEGEKR